MTKFTKLLLAFFILLALTGLRLVYTEQSKSAVVVCGVSSTYLPLVVKDAGAMTKTKNEHIELLTRTLADFPYDGRIHEIFTDTVNVKQVGSQKIIHGVQVPSHIDVDKLKLGMPVRLNKSAGRPYISDYFPQFDDEDVNYAGQGTIIPNPPQISVTATKDGWLVSWQAIDGTDHYQVYQNDTPDETTPDEVELTTQRQITIPYDGFPPTYKYFAVKSISGLNESELSAWITDAIPPPIPDTFQAINAVDGHQLVIDGNDASLSANDFKCWEIEIADDDIGTNSESLGYFYPESFPVFQSFGAGTTKWYRIRAFDYGGVASDWTDWDDAWVLQGEVKDLFDNYGGVVESSLTSLYWLQISDFEEGLTTYNPSDQETDKWYEMYGATIQEVDNITSGSKAVKVTDPPDQGGYWRYYLAKKFSTPMELDVEGRFSSDNDFVCFTIKIEGDSPLDTQDTLFLYFWTTVGGFSYATYDFTLSPLGYGTHYICIQKSEFEIYNDFDWSNIESLFFDLYKFGSVPTNFGITHDDLRIAKFDPDDTTTYNDTGAAWDKAAHTGSDTGEWHIYAGNRSGEPPKPYSYGQIKTATTPAVWYMSHKPLSTTNIFSGTIQAGVFLKDDDGQAGLTFFVKDVTADNWNMYAIEADSDNNTIKLVKWVDGTRTEIGSTSFTFDPDEILWLGADFKEYDSDGGRIKIYASLSEGNLIQAANLILSEQDTERIGDAGGSVGLLSYQANTRFVNFVAGSPAHAETADVAFALDGTILAGETKRVRINPDTLLFEYSDDGQVWTNLHSKLVAPDGSPDPALSIDNTGYVDLEGKQAFRANDDWLRLNQVGEFSNGVYTPGHLRVDGGLNVEAGTLQLPLGTTINEFSTDGTLAGNSDDAVPTEKAVKTYVDANGNIAGAIQYYTTANRSIADNTWYYCNYNTSRHQTGTNYFSYSSEKYYFNTAGYYTFRLSMYLTRASGSNTKWWQFLTYIYNSAAGVVQYLRDGPNTNTSDTGWMLNKYSTSVYIWTQGIFYVPANGFAQFRFKHSDSSSTTNTLQATNTYSFLSLARIA
jgi:hypothetical protein